MHKCCQVEFTLLICREKGAVKEGLRRFYWKGEGKKTIDEYKFSLYYYVSAPDIMKPWDTKPRKPFKRKDKGFSLKSGTAGILLC